MGWDPIYTGYGKTKTPETHPPFGREFAYFGCVVLSLFGKYVTRNAFLSSKVEHSSDCF